MVDAILVYADSTVGLTPLRSALPTLRFPKPTRMSVLAGDSSMPLSIECEEFRLREHMFDERPVYCTPAHELKRALITTYATARDAVDAVDAENVRAVRRLLDKDCGDRWFEIDRRVGAWPLPPWERAKMQAKGITLRGCGLLVAVKK